MCGIIYLENLEGNAIKALLKRYTHQKHRGTDGFGFVSIDATLNRVVNIRRKTSEKEITAELEKIAEKAILFHHRYPTSTPNLKEACHPITVRNKRLKNVYYVIHNGIISNPETLKVKHEELGYEYTTEIVKETVYKTKGIDYIDTVKMFNDSEALAIELAEVIDGQKVSIEAKGSIAFVVVQADKKGNVKNLYYGHNNLNPLMIEENSNIFSIKSEGGKALETETLFCRNYETKEITKTPMLLGSTVSPYQNHVGYNTEGYKWTKEDEDDMREYNYSYGYPPTGATLFDYMESDNMLDYPIDQLQADGHSLTDIKEMLEDDVCTLEEIIQNAEYSNDKETSEQAQMLLDEMDSRIKKVDGLIYEQNTETMALNF